MKTYKIHLLRHGLTEGNLSGRFIGSTDLPLHEKGIEELRRLKAEAKYPEAELFYSSPMIRCRQTMELLYGDVPITLAEGLRECDLGEFEGLTGEELEDNASFTDWIGGRSEGPPGGETGAAFAQRCVTAFHLAVKELLSSGRRSVLICTHGGVIMSILATCGLPEHPAPQWMIGNGRGFTLSVTPGIWMRGGKVEVVGTFPYEIANIDEEDTLNSAAEI